MTSEQLVAVRLEVARRTPRPAPREEVDRALVQPGRVVGGQCPAANSAKAASRRSWPATRWALRIACAARSAIPTSEVEVVVVERLVVLVAQHGDGPERPASGPERGDDGAGLAVVLEGARPARGRG